jgi:hypothetical protein
VISPECSFQVDFWGKTRVKLWFPVLLSLGSSLLKEIVRYFRYRKGLLGNKFKKKDVLFSFLLIFDKMTMLFFTMILSTIVSLFDCVKISDEYFVIRSFPAERCFTSDWISNLGQISPLIVLYMLVFPLRLCWILYKMSLFPQMRKNPEFRYLTQGYKPAFFWWDAILLLKRVAFISISQFLVNAVDSSGRLLSSISVLCIYTTVELVLEPFLFNAVPKNNLNIMLILFLLCQGLIFQNDDSQANSIFVGFVIVIFILCTSHSIYIVMKRMFRKKHSSCVFINQDVLSQLSPDARKELLVLWSHALLDKHGELEFGTEILLKNQRGFTFQEIISYRRQCDVLYGEPISDASSRPSHFKLSIRSQQTRT